MTEIDDVGNNLLAGDTQSDIGEGGRQPSSANDEYSVLHVTITFNCLLQC